MMKLLALASIYVSFCTQIANAGFSNWTRPFCSRQERFYCPDTKLLELMSVKGCLPEYEGESCCPYRFECIENFAEKAKGKCYFSGRFYDDGEPVESDQICKTSCICEDEIIKCQRNECSFAQPGTGLASGIDPAGTSMPGPGVTPPPGPRIPPSCFETFTEGQCCATGFGCPGEVPLKCVRQTSYDAFKLLAYGGQKFTVEGDRYPDHCQECLCTSSFTGPYGPECKPLRFFTDYPLQTDTPFNKFVRNKIVAGCVPVSGRTSCFNSGFVCPDEVSVKPCQGSNQGGKDKCKFGDVFISKGQFLQFTKPQNFECECVVPPDVICTFIERDQPPSDQQPPEQLPIGPFPSNPAASK